MLRSVNRALRPLLALTLSLAACAAYAEHEPLRGPDGELWFLVRCRGGMSFCYQEAGAVCRAGYVEADASNMPRFAEAKTDHEMIVKCRAGQ